MTIELSKQDKEYLKNLPEGEEIIAAEEKLTTFYLDYQLILYWVDGVCLLFALSITIVFALLKYINVEKEDDQWWFFLIQRGLLIVTHLSGVLAAKFKADKLLVLAIALGLLVIGLEIYNLVKTLRKAEPKEAILIYYLQAIFTQGVISILRVVYLLRLSKKEKGKGGGKKTMSNTK